MSRKPLNCISFYKGSSIQMLQKEREREITETCSRESSMASVYGWSAALTYLCGSWALCMLCLSLWFSAQSSPHTGLAPSHAPVKAPIHVLTQSCDLISLCGKPVERTSEIIRRPISLVRSTDFPQQLIWSHDWVRLIRALPCIWCVSSTITSFYLTNFSAGSFIAVM